MPSFVEISPVVLEEKIFKFAISLEKGMAMNLTKLVSSSPKDAWWQVWLKLNQVYQQNLKIWRKQGHKLKTGGPRATSLTWENSSNQ